MISPFMIHVNVKESQIPINHLPYPSLFSAMQKERISLELHASVWCILNTYQLQWCVGDSVYCHELCSILQLCCVCPVFHHCCQTLFFFFLSWS
ncbi:unnamed protein product [Musa acuminata var. zebrina]